MAESTELKRQNLEGGGGGGSEPPLSASEPPSSAEKSKNGSEPPSSAEKSKNASEPPLSAEKSKNGSEPPSLSPEKGGLNPKAFIRLNPNDECNEKHFYSDFVRNMDDILPEGTLKEHVPEFFEIWMNYKRQNYNSDGFDCDYYPCGSYTTCIQPVINPDTGHAELMMELANLAIQEYNEKECNDFKYKVVKIEKATFMLTSFYQYRMTVKVLNLTLGTTIETFQIFAAQRIFWDDKLVLYCQPKDETKRRGEFVIDVPKGKERHMINRKGFALLPCKFRGHFFLLQLHAC